MARTKAIWTSFRSAPAVTPWTIRRRSSPASRRCLFPRGYGRRVEPIVSQDQPLPMTLAGGDLHPPDERVSIWDSEAVVSGVSAAVSSEPSPDTRRVRRMRSFHANRRNGSGSAPAIELKRHKRNVRRSAGRAAGAIRIRRCAWLTAARRWTSLPIRPSEAELDKKLIEVGGEARASFEESQARKFRRSGRNVFAEGLLTAAANIVDELRLSIRFRAGRPFPAVRYGPTVNY